jgi:23S rRNA pseudouridine2605 synthase
MDNNNAQNRLSKVLAAAGIAARRKCEELIFAGQVTVNGELCLVPQTLVSPDKDTIAVKGVSITGSEKKVAFLLNKPKGFLCSTKGTKSCSRCVLDIFRSIPLRLFTVGRLDKETTGLLIVTNDGHFANQVIHPSASIEKEYVATVSIAVTDVRLEGIRKGTLVEDCFVKPILVELLSPKMVKVVVMEGKKREVRLLLEGVGLHVQALKRTRLGQLTLGDLKEGSFRPLTLQDRDLILAKP